jgi:phosphorylcholine metabolism protein LicD
MEKSKEDFDKFKIPETTKNILLEMMNAIHKVLTEHKIKYFVEGGSLLGAVRHRGIIPWDDDIDIGVFDKDFEKIIPLFEKTIVNNPIIPIQLERCSKDMIKVFVTGLWFQNKQTKQIIGTPTLDIFKYTKGNNIVKLASISERIRFPNCYYKCNELFPLKEYTFDNITVMGANNPLPFLHRYYGNDCLTKWKVDVRKDDGLQKDRNKIEL